MWGPPSIVTHAVHTVERKVVVAGFTHAAFTHAVRTVEGKVVIAVFSIGDRDGLSCSKLTRSMEPYGWTTRRTVAIGIHCRWYALVIGEIQERHKQPADAV